jgi:divalent metal cation (Fe/Co/Zn/Cd) transporter
MARREVWSAQGATVREVVSESTGVDGFRAAATLSWASVAWTTVTTAAAVAAGVAANSLALVMFGLTGALDAAGSVLIALHFAHATRQGIASAAREQQAHRVVSIGLVTLGVTTVALAAARLASGDAASESTPGVVLAAVSMIVLLGLAFGKRRLARAVGSPALAADAVLTLTGAALAALTLGGTTLLAVMGWRWADAAAAGAIGLAAVGAGARSARSSGAS